MLYWQEDKKIYHHNDEKEYQVIFDHSSSLILRPDINEGICLSEKRLLIKGPKQISLKCLGRNRDDKKRSQRDCPPSLRINNDNHILEWQPDSFKVMSLQIVKWGSYLPALNLQFTRSRINLFRTQQHELKYSSEPVRLKAPCAFPGLILYLSW